MSIFDDIDEIDLGSWIVEKASPLGEKPRTNTLRKFKLSAVLAFAVAVPFAAFAEKSPGVPQAQGAASVASATARVHSSPANVEVRSEVPAALSALSALIKDIKDQKPRLVTLASRELALAATERSINLQQDAEIEAWAHSLSNSVSRADD